MEQIGIILAAGTLCIACFLIGAKVGQKVSKGEDITLPKVAIPNPMEAMKENRVKKEEEAEMNKITTVLENIERYDGTSRGQKDVPR